MFSTWQLTGQWRGCHAALTWFSGWIWIVRSRSDGSNLSVPIRIIDLILALDRRSNGSPWFPGGGGATVTGDGADGGAGSGVDAPDAPVPPRTREDVRDARREAAMAMGSSTTSSASSNRAGLRPMARRFRRAPPAMIRCEEDRGEGLGDAPGAGDQRRPQEDEELFSVTGNRKKKRRRTRGTPASSSGGLGAIWARVQEGKVAAGSGV